MVPVYPVVQNPGPRLCYIKGFCQQLVDVEYFNTTSTHQLDKHIVIFLRLLDPEHIIEQQRIAIARGESAMGQPRSANDDLPKSTGLRMNAQFIFCHALNPR